MLKIGNFKPHQLISTVVQKAFSTSQYVTSEEINKSARQYTFFSWSAQNLINPIAVVKAKGCYFWNAEGKRFFDMNSQLMCTNIGHGNEKVIKAIQDQAAELPFAHPAFSTRIRAEIGPLLARHTPGDLKKFFFCLGGAESVENAIKFAKFYTKRNKIMSRFRSYHGATQGAISVTGDPRRWPNEPSLPGTIKLFDPYKYRSHLYEPGMTDDQFSEKIIKEYEEILMYENPEAVAAIIVESVTGTNGVIIPPEGYLPRLRQLCTKYGIMLICDEVMSGFGRTGEWFGVDNWKVVPDIMTMAKGITSAYTPLGCVAINPKIAKEFEYKKYSGGLTYNAHPLCLAASCATIKFMEEADVVGNSKRMGKVMAGLMKKMQEKHPSVGEIRNIGLFGAIELVKNRKTKEPLSPFGFADSEAMTKTMGYLKQNGVFAFSYSNIMLTNPPLIVTEPELKEAFEVIDKALDIADSYYKA